MGQTVSKWPRNITGRPSPREAGTEMVPALLLRQHVDGRTGLAQHVGQDGSAAIDRRLVRAG